MLVDLTIPVHAPNGGVEEATEPGGSSFSPEIPVARTTRLTMGRFPDGGARFTGRFTLEKVSTPLCHLVLQATTPKS